MTTEDTRTYRVLVVDDDPVSRKMLVYALKQEDFACDTAGDGVQASEMLEKNRYDLVVSDLRMPNKHGHSLAVELLELPERPAIIIHTAVDDPRMTKDLLTRGVDDVVYKPTNYATFAARARVLVQRRRTAGQLDQALAEVAKSSGAKQFQTTPDSLEKRPDETPVDLTKILPISQTAINVYRLTQQPESETSKIAATIAVDASLAAELLVLGNSPHFNPSCRKIIDLEEVVVRIGRRRIGELALATSARASLSRQMIPWIDVDFIWRRSIAAGLAAELLFAEAGHGDLEEGLFLSAIFHPLGRVVLASIFAETHAKLVEQCSHSGETLTTAERGAFGRTHTEIMAELLGQWHIPPEITFPLKHALDSYSSLNQFPEVDRTRTELLKLAMFLAAAAVGHWQPWETIRLPPTDTLRRLGVKALVPLVERTREGCLSIIRQQSDVQDVSLPHEPRTEPIGYHSFSAGGSDFLAAVLPSLGFEPVYGDLESQETVLVNCLEVDTSLVARLLPTGKHRFVFLTDGKPAKSLASLGKVLVLPTSCARLRQACHSEGELAVL
jgi:DNA-binding response OmpR family regulator